MTEKTLTTENIKPALDALRGELAPWPVVAMKQDRLNDTQKSAVNSGITSSLVAQIIANTAAIRALESAITGTGLRALVVASLPAIGTQGILYIVPVTTYDPATDADVVNYSNEYIWIVAPDAPVTEGYYEQVGQTGIVINNGQLTITVNGTSVGTFTANQSGDTTAAITVPTNADYVDKTTAQSIAGVKTFSSTINGTAAKAIADEDGTSIKTGYGKLAGSQTWTGNNTFQGETRLKNTSIQKGAKPSSNSDEHITFLDKNNASMGFIRYLNNADGGSSIELKIENLYKDGQVDTTGTSNYSYFSLGLTNDGQRQARFASSLFPFHNSAYSLGSSSYQWSSVYAQSYYYNGTAWGLDKANTWTGVNTFSVATAEGVAVKYMTYKGAILFRTNGVSNFKNYNTFFKWDISGYDNTFGLYRSVGVLGDTTTGATDEDIDTSFSLWKAHIRSKSLDFTDSVKATNDGTENSLKPITTSVTDLGTSTNKWKTLNGINPGALSLPDLNNTVDITSTFNTAIDKTQTVNSYTADFTGWLFINWWTEGLTNPFYVYVYCTNSATDNNLLHAIWGQSFSISGNVDYMLTQFPVISGKTYWFVTNFSRASTDTKNLAYSVRKLLCLGNV